MARSSNSTKAAPKAQRAGPWGARTRASTEATREADTRSSELVLFASSPAHVPSQASNAASPQALTFHFTVGTYESGSELRATWIGFVTSTKRAGMVGVTRHILY